MKIHATKASSLAGDRLQHYVGPQHWTLRDALVRPAVLAAAIQYVRSLGGSTLCYRRKHFDVKQQADATVLREIYGPDFDFGSVELALDRTVATQLMEFTPKTWDLIEPLEPIGNLIEIMKAIRPADNVNLRYRRGDIPMALVLAAHETLKTKQRDALRCEQSQQPNAIANAKQAGTAYADLAMHLFNPYRSISSHIEEIDLELIRRPRLKDALDEGFCDRMRAASDHPATEHIIRDYINITAVLAHAIGE